jgi:hypothetical protein
MQFLHIDGSRNVDRDLGVFPPDLELLVRRLIAKGCKLPEAENASSRLLGREVTFYKNVWLGLLELADGHRYYFLTRPRGRKGRLVPISNAIGAVDRANRQYALNLTRDNVADYLNFYFAFTPKEDPMLSRMPGGRGTSQFAVPRGIDDLQIEGSEQATPAVSGQDGLQREMLGARRDLALPGSGKPPACHPAALQAAADQAVQGFWPHPHSVQARGVRCRLSRAARHRCAGP